MVLFKTFLIFSRGHIFTRTISQFFYRLDILREKNGQSCPGQRSRRQILIAVADFGLRLLFILLRSPKSATNTCRSRRLWSPVVLDFVAVAEVGDKICRVRRLRPPVIFQFVAVAEVGDKILSQSPTSVSIGAIRGMVRGASWGAVQE